MKRARNDFKVVPNNQKNRSQDDLWDVVAGGELILTAQGRDNAEAQAVLLNMDPWHLDRGQTRFERTGTRLSMERPE